MIKYYAYNDWLICCFLNRTILINKFGLFGVKIFNTVDLNKIKEYLKIDERTNILRAEKFQIEIFKSKLDEYIDNLQTIKDFLKNN